MSRHLLGILKERGYKVTAQRAGILKVMLRADGPLTAQEVWESIRPQFPGISLDTVYRTLHLLVNAGVACQLNLMGRHNARFQIDSESHHHHVICLGCGKATRLDFCPVRRVGEVAGFRVVNHAFEVYGYCVECETV